MTSERTKLLLYGLSAGYCQYEGCPKRLLGDDVTCEVYNVGQAGHVVAQSDRGPRGDVELSGILADDIENVMLLCYEHHRLVDKQDPAGHPRERLLAMKQAQEERISLACGIPPQNKSHVLIYAANIGDHKTVLDFKATASALLPQRRYPASRKPLLIQTIP